MTSRYCCQAATIAAIANNHILRFSTVGALSAPLALQSARPSAVATRTEQLASAPGMPTATQLYATTASQSAAAS